MIRNRIVKMDMQVFVLMVLRLSCAGVRLCRIREVFRCSRLNVIYRRSNDSRHLSFLMKLLAFHEHPES